MESILNWVGQWGYWGLFLALAFGVVGVPVPDEALLMFVGFLSYQGRMDGGLALVTAFASSICGVSLTYLLGRTLGYWLVHRYGSVIRITPQHLDKVHEWFEHYGRWTLVVGYFVPGLRQGVPYVAGMTRMSFWTFAVCCFGGGLLWSAVFVGAGYLLGPQWETVLRWVERGHLALLGLIVVALLVYVVIAILRRRNRREESCPDR
jgi:membrane protein DedA with SNARE-associated domain